MTQPDWLKSSHILLFKNAFLILILSDDFLPEKSGTDKILCHLKCCIIEIERLKVKLKRKLSKLKHFVKKYKKTRMND